MSATPVFFDGVRNQTRFNFGGVDFPRPQKLPMNCPRCHGTNFNWAKRCDHCGHDFSRPDAPGDAAERTPRIRTPTGAEIELMPVTSVQIDLLRRCWPLGLEEWPPTTAKYGLICRRPDQDLMAVKFQQVDVPMAKAPLVRFQNRVLIALAMRGYLERRHQGFIMPCAYTRRKGADQAETGIAYLVGPHPESRSVSEEAPDQRWDAALGAGATAMVADFAREVGRVHHQAPQGASLGGASVGQPYFLTMEVRPVGALGILDPRLAVLGGEALVTMPDPASSLDSAWDFVFRAGFKSLSHFPLAPVERRADGSLHPL